ncbi:MAG: hypothetical protein R3310_09500 [Candidatus Competibacteraceae bacterium]|nr:hypothetical protein [Candidatus Competibacteraceae bacterium]
MLEQSEVTAAGRRVVRGRSARNQAMIMDIGNIVAVLIPFPLIIFWFGASVLVYALMRHHPNEKVGHYTQWAAYRFYGVTGFFTAVAIFFPGGDWTWYLYSWAAAVVVIVPWSLLDLRKIINDQWHDIYIQDNTESKQHG